MEIEASSIRVGRVRRGGVADHEVMRRLNRSLVLEFMRAEKAPLTRSSIAERTSLAKPTVSDIVEGLIAEGIVHEIGVGAASSGGGRRPLLIEFNAESQFVAGVHVGVHSTTVLIGNARGEEVRRERVETPVVPAEVSLRRIARLIRQLGEADGLLPRLASAAIVLPGLVDTRGGRCILAPNIGWHHVPVGSVLAEHLNMPVVVHNVSQASVIAESTEGAAKGEEDVVLLYGGRGVGAGALSDGRLIHGAVGVAGEIGHCRVPGESLPCNCGNRGCLETVASTGALVASVWSAIMSGRATSLARVGRGELSPRLIGNAARDGDTVAINAIENMGRYLGLGASWLVNLFDPEVLVIAGSVAEFGELVVGPLRQVLDETATEAVAGRLRVRVSALGQDAEVRGAVLLALQALQADARVVYHA